MDTFRPKRKRGKAKVSYYAFCSKGHPLWRVSGYPTERSAQTALEHHNQDGHAVLDFGVGKDQP